MSDKPQALRFNSTEGGDHFYCPEEYTDQGATFKRICDDGVQQAEAKGGSNIDKGITFSDHLYAEAGHYTNMTTFTSDCTTSWYQFQVGVGFASYIKVVGNTVYYATVNWSS